MAFQIGEWVKVKGFLRGQIVELEGEKFVIEHSPGTKTYGKGFQYLEKVETEGQILMEVVK